MQNYYAHTDPRPGLGLPDGANVIWQPLREHLLHVAHRARRLARAAKPDDPEFAQAAARSGLAHDLGKYTDAFQLRLRNLARGDQAAKAPHAIFGASWAHRQNALDIAFSCLGHHAGLPSQRDLQQKCTDCSQETLEAILTAANQPHELGTWLGPLPSNSPLRGRKPIDPRWELRQRMLLSVLVDADRLDCQRFEQRVLGQPHSLSGPPLNAHALLEALLHAIENKAAKMPAGVVKDCRAHILQACLAAADRPERLQSLCVPTGGGKTLASMAFALRRAVLHSGEVRRIIVVIPYLSIIEQTAEELNEIFSPLGRDLVLEHHSGELFVSRKTSAASGPGEEPEDASNLAEERRRRLLTENWDAPVVITTSVRFFDSLFSNHPSDLRRIHNIARAVVILDEVQTLSPHLLAPLLSMMKGLSDDWSTTFLFCTATQPAFEKHALAEETDPRWEPGTIRPILKPEKQKALFTALRRVADPVWPTREQKTAWPEVARQLIEARRAICIVNTKEHARQLYTIVREQALHDKMTEGSVFHLSTRMCAKHRLDRLGVIRERLKDPAEPPCLVISTQLLEAGVDISAPTVFRAMGPFDAIVQAAGRCDREGHLTARLGKPAGKLVVFEPEEDKTPYPGPTETTRNLIQKAVQAGSAWSIHDVLQMTRYFNEYFSTKGMDLHCIELLRGALDFPAVAEAFAMIDDCSQSVLVPYGKGTEHIEKLKQTGWLSRDEWRDAQRYQVGLNPKEFKEALRVGAIYEFHQDRPNKHKGVNDVNLFIANPENYDEKTDVGLRLASLGLICE